MPEWVNSYSSDWITANYEILTDDIYNELKKIIIQYDWKPSTALSWKNIRASDFYARLEQENLEEYNRIKKRQVNLNNIKYRKYI